MAKRSKGKLPVREQMDPVEVKDVGCIFHWREGGDGTLLQLGVTATSVAEATDYFRDSYPGVRWYITEIVRENHKAQK